MTHERVSKGIGARKRFIMQQAVQNPKAEEITPAGD